MTATPSGSLLVTVAVFAVAVIVRCIAAFRYLPPHGVPLYGGVDGVEYYRLGAQLDARPVSRGRVLT